LYRSGARRPRGPTRFPYATLFRSEDNDGAHVGEIGHVLAVALDGDTEDRLAEVEVDLGDGAWVWATAWAPLHGDDDPQPEPGSRSEEHTSELQSRENLVCRLLLEK